MDPTNQRLWTEFLSSQASLLARLIDEDLGLDLKVVGIYASQHGTVHILCMVQGSSVLVFGSRFLVRTALADGTDGLSVVNV